MSKSVERFVYHRMRFRYDERQQSPVSGELSMSEPKDIKPDSGELRCSTATDLAWLESQEDAALEEMENASSTGYRDLKTGEAKAYRAVIDRFRRSAKRQ